MEISCKNYLIFSAKAKWKSIVSDFIAYYIALVFLYIAMHQLADYAQLQNFIESLRFLPSVFKFMVWVLPFSETVLSVLLVFNSTRKISLYGSVYLMFMITIWLISIRLYFPANLIPCHCIAAMSKLSWNQHIVLNIVLTLLGVTGIKLFYKQAY